MSQLTCPHCHEVFQVDESSYQEIVNQVKTTAFYEEVHQKLEDELEKNNLKLQANFDQKLSEKNENLSTKNSEIDKLTERLETIEKTKNLENAESLSKQAESYRKEAEEQRTKITLLEAQLLTNKESQNQEIIIAKNQVEKEKASEIKALEFEISSLKSEAELSSFKAENELKSQKENYEIQLKLKDEQVEQYKNFKQSQSTKAIGESLENYCKNKYDTEIRPFVPQAYFEKDNEISKSGSKGDFIYREMDSQGNEILSIMFEMKNEADFTEKKHRNEHFFKELDKDRKEKNCEYAVLVTMLEADNERYNAGIVEEYNFEKFYVIRPQFFTTIISFLRKAALGTVEYKQKVLEIENRDIDVTHFEEILDKFKDGFSKNYDSASKHSESVLDEIDKTIARLEAVKRELGTTFNQLRLANNKLDDLTIKKLTYNNPTMKAKFAEAASDRTI